MLEHAVEIKRLIGSRVKLIMNDRADLCLAAGLMAFMWGRTTFPRKA